MGNLSTKEKRARDPFATICQKCKSEDTKSFEMVYAEGTSSGTVTAGSYTIGDGVTLTKGKISSQTELALRVRPPEEPDFNIFLLFGIVLSSFIITMIIVSYFDGSLKLLLGIGITALSAVGGYLLESRRLQLHKEEYKKNFAAWRRSWICMRCGNTWKRVSIS